VPANNKKAQSLRYMITGKIKKRFRQRKEAKNASKGGEVNG
jgi:hypothetical protein